MKGELKGGKEMTEQIIVPMILFLLGLLFLVIANSMKEKTIIQKLCFNMGILMLSGSQMLLIWYLTSPC